MTNYRMQRSAMAWFSTKKHLKYIKMMKDKKLDGKMAGEKQNFSQQKRTYNLVLTE